MSSKRMVYANEIDKTACEWMRSLPIRIDSIDERSITEVTGADLDGFTQCHFFAGIAGWPLALQMAGWPADAPVWTGSCLCQPFSAAGRQRGTDDERHLWPEFRRLIAERRPATVFGEQVASKLGREWLAVVRADLEALGYAVGAADLCAASVGAPHIRQRLFWVADADGRDASTEGLQRSREHGQQSQDRLAGFGLVHAANGRPAKQEPGKGARRPSEPCGLGDANSIEHRQESQRRSDSQGTAARRERIAGQPGSAYWTDADFTPCRDGKARPVKPGVRLLAYGIPGRVAQLRGLGNAIVPQVAATFVKSFMES